MKKKTILTRFNEYPFLCLYFTHPMYGRIFHKLASGSEHI